MSENTRHISIDLTVIKGCQKGEAEAQKQLYEQCGRLVMSVCLRYTANEADAEDVFQESFIAIFEQIKSLRHPRGLVSWMYKIIISKVIRYYRKRVQIEEVTEWNTQPAADNREHEIIQAISAGELLALVQQLPDGYRLVFNLYVMEGFSHGEIAGMVGINEATSRSQLFKAKRWLKRRIVETYGIHSYEK